MIVGAGERRIGEAGPDSTVVLVGVLVDGGGLAEWQRTALQSLGDHHRLRFYECTNMRGTKKRFSHYPYYLLNLLSLRTAITRRRMLPGDLERDRFECEHEGMWQRLPQSLIDKLHRDGVDVIVKFGMGLLRIPDQLRPPILSYHHGDPRRYRGRPAGFYELQDGALVIGQIVQRLCNQLDAGAVLAYAETKVVAHSYRQTMRAAYRLSPLLLRRSIENVLKGRYLELQPSGAITRLPSPVQVMRFVAQRLRALLRHLAYGAFFEKAWRVAEAELPSDHALPVSGDLPARDSWRIHSAPPGYTFLADPFFHPSRPGIVVEAMGRFSGVGDIILLDDGDYVRLLSGGHYSYPGSIETSDGQFLLPEAAEQGGPKIFRWKGSGLEPGVSIEIGGEARLIDPTIFQRAGVHYLFGNDLQEGAGVLRMWSSPALAGPYVEHPASPICLSPAGARMGGLLFERDGRLYRLGQDGRGDYGNGLVVFAVEDLSPKRYREAELRVMRFAGDRTKGPHTLNMIGGRLLFDFYEDRFSLLAGFRRIRGRWTGWASHRPAAAPTSH